MLLWLVSRVGIIYVLMFIFFISSVDLKNLDMRIKTRRLNDAIPDFSDMVLFAQNPEKGQNIDLSRYQSYLTLVNRYVPDDFFSHQLSAYTAYYRGDVDHAIALYKGSALVHGQSLFWSDFNLGVIFYKKRMWQNALEYLFKAIGSNSQLNLILMNNSQVFKQIANSPFFRSSLNAGIHEAQSQAYVLLLSCFNHLKLYDKTILISNIALENPDLLYKDAFYYYQGLAYLEIGDLAKAFMVFQKSLLIEKDNPDVYYYLANIYQKLGRSKESQNLFELGYTLHQKSTSHFPYDDHVNVRFY